MELLSCARSARGFSYNDYDNDNQNSNVSSHRCENCTVQALALAKKQTTYPAVGIPKGKKGGRKQAKRMKRIGNLFEQIISIENLNAADTKAQKGKKKQYGVQVHLKNRDANIQALHDSLRNETYRTSQYTTFTVYEPKERIVYRLPYYPDRILHHAVMNVMEPVFVGTFTADTYSCIKGRGIHAAARSMKKALRDTENTRYCLKMDITKFYPNVDHAILKALLRRKLKDRRLLNLLDEIIDSAEGLPIGNYLSQYLANFYLTYFDHWLKETKRVQYYFRYADDMVILAGSKEYLHQLLQDIKQYLDQELKLHVKENHQVFPVAARGIDFVGYRFYHTHTLLRKSIKKNFARAVAKGKGPASLASYAGWAKHCNTVNLLKKLLPMHSFKELNIKPSTTSFKGDKIKIERIINREITVLAYKIEDSKFQKKGAEKCLYLQFMIGENTHVTFTGSRVLMDMIQQVPVDKFPFKTTISKDNEYYEFT